MASKEQRDRMTISSMETFFDGLLRGKVTDALYFGDLPVNISKKWKEIVVVDCGNPMRNKGVFTSGTVLIYIYARQNAYGLKDVATMQKVEQLLSDVIEANDDPHYHTSIMGSYANFDAINDMYFNIIQVHLVIT